MKKAGRSLVLLAITLSLFWWAGEINRQYEIDASPYYEVSHLLELAQNSDNAQEMYTDLTLLTVAMYKYGYDKSQLAYYAYILEIKQKSQELGNAKHDDLNFVHLLQDSRRYSVWSTPIDWSVAVKLVAFVTLWWLVLSFVKSIKELLERPKRKNEVFDEDSVVETGNTLEVDGTTLIEVIEPSVRRI